MIVRGPRVQSRFLRVTASERRSSASIVLAALAAGQFVMALDSSVMNVSIPVVAEDVGTDVTGIQTAITMYTLVMASLMITGGKVGAMIGRKRAFIIGCCRLRGRFAHHRVVAESADAVVRVVAARRSRRGAHPSGDRGAGGIELRSRGPPARLRPACPRRWPSPWLPVPSSAAWPRPTSRGAGCSSAK